MGRLSMSQSRESIWVWLFWGLSTFLVLELGTFLLASLALNKPVGDLVGPFLSYAIPAAILLALVWWLRKREDNGAASPKQLARAWGVSMILFLVAVISATCYSGVMLHLMSLSDAIATFIVSFLMGVPIAYFVSYGMTLNIISSRAGKRHGGSGSA